RALPASPGCDITPRALHVLVDRKQLDDVVGRLKRGPEAGIVRKIDEIEPGRGLDRAEKKPCRIEHGAGAVDGVNVGGTELGYSTSARACSWSEIPARIFMTRLTTSRAGGASGAS